MLLVFALFVQSCIISDGQTPLPSPDLYNNIFCYNISCFCMFVSILNKETISAAEALLKKVFSCE